MKIKYLSKLCRFHFSKDISNIRLSKNYTTCPAGMKVTLCGAAGKTGQPLSLLLKQCPQIDQLALYDLHNTSVLELNQMDTKCKAVAYHGTSMLRDALKDSNVVVIMTKNQCDSLENNAPAVIEMASQICTFCPMAITIIATEPVHSLLPIAAEIQKFRSAYNPRSLLGCVELHQARASAVLARLLGVPDEDVKLSCIGGVSSDTLVPLLMNAVYPGKRLEHNQIEYVTYQIMNQPPPTPDMSSNLVGAYMIAKTVTNVVRALQGERNIVQMIHADQMCQFPYDCPYISCEMQLGPSGIEYSKKPELSEFEQCLLCNVLPHVHEQILTAVKYVCDIWNTTANKPWPRMPCTPCEARGKPTRPPAPWCLDQTAYRDKFVNNICQELLKKKAAHDDGYCKL